MTDGPEEIEIDRLRLAAFQTNSNEDKAAYYLAVSKWFQDRHYRTQPTPTTTERDTFEEWAAADNRDIQPEDFEDRNPGNYLYYKEDSTNQAYIGWHIRSIAPTPTTAGVTEAMVSVPKELIDRFPEINPANYDASDAIALNNWGTEVVLASRALSTAPPGDGVPGMVLVPAIADIAAERRRQIEAEGWTPDHDDEHDAGEMARAAGCYALHGFFNNGKWSSPRYDIEHYLWPWSLDWWKPSDPRRNLVKAGALIAAEIERLDRLSASTAGAGK